MADSIYGKMTSEEQSLYGAMTAEELAAAGGEAAPAAPADPIDEAILSVGGDPALVRRAKTFSPDAINAALAPVSKQPEMQGAVGLSHGLAQKGLGIAQHGLRLAGGLTQLGDGVQVGPDGSTPPRQEQPTDADLHYVEVLQKLGDRAYNETKAPGVPAKVARGLGMVGAEAVSSPAGPVNIVNKAGKVAAAMGGGALAGVLAPDLAADVTSEEDTYGANMAGNAALGAGIGGVVGAVSGVGKVIGGKVANAGKDNAPGLTPKAKEVIDFARRGDIPFRLGDVYQRSGALRAVENWITPVAVTSKAEDKLAGVAGDYAEQLNSATKSTRFTPLDANRATKRTRIEEAKALKGELRAARTSRDPDRIMEASGKLERLNAKLQSDMDYERVGLLADKVPTVGSTNFVAKLDEVISKYGQNPNMRLDDNYFVQNLMKMREQASRTQMTGRAAVDARKDLATRGKELAKEKGNPGPDATQAIVDELRAARRLDLMEGARTAKVKKLDAALAEADNNYQKTVDLKESRLAKTLDAPNLAGDQIYKKFIGRDSADLSRQFYDTLDPKGRAAVRERMVADAFNRASEGGRFTPERYADEWEALQKDHGVFFTGTDKQQADGLANVMRHFDRIGKNSSSSAAQNAQRALGAGTVLLTGGGATAAKATGGMIGGSQLLSKILNGPSNQKFWLAASDLKPGSRAMTDLVNRAAAQAASREYAASQTSQGANNE